MPLVEKFQLKEEVVEEKRFSHQLELADACCSLAEYLIGRCSL